MTTNRLEAFSDGVIAIIITIMVLELKVPHGVEHVSHTAGLAGDAQVCDAFLAQCGVQQVASLSEMTDAAKLLLWGAGATVVSPALVSVSGGAGALITDALCDMGLTLPPFAREVEQAVHAALPSFGKANNPLDLTGMVGADPTILGKVLEPIVHGGQNDMVLVFIGVKMLIDPHDSPPRWFQVEIPISVSLLVVGGIILVSVVLSIAKECRMKKAE